MQTLWSPWLRPAPSSSKTVGLVFMDYFTFTVAALWKVPRSVKTVGGRRFGRGQRGWKEERQDMRGREGAALGARIEFSAYQSQICAYHIVRSVHTQRASVFKANGHQLQFSSDAHFGISIHPLLLVYLIARSNKQTNKDFTPMRKLKRQR